MKKKLLILFSFLYMLSNAQLGKEAWHWQFGSRCVLDFSSGAPFASLNPISFGTNFASASISDPDSGQLLFYTDARKVFNKSGSTMMNGAGLNGGYFSTQVIIVPQPGSSTLYYLITCGEAANIYGVQYSVIDLSFYNGYGKVTLKNQSLTPAPATAKVTAVRNCNGTDYWIITHSYNSDAFNAYALTSAGINLTPIVSHCGTLIQNFTPYSDEACGFLKASPNGKKLASSIGSDSLPIFEVFDFNNSTGVVSNPTTINYSGIQGAPFGISFSPDNSKLYTCVEFPDSTNKIFQYDVSSSIPSTIIASQVTVAQKKWIAPYIGQTGAMQIAPDGKIYMSLSYKDSLSVINNPNSAGLGCNIQWDVVPLALGSFCYMGLPNFIDANYAGIQINIPDVQQCNTFTTTTLDAGSGFANYFWSTGASTQTISINSPGKYWVTVTSAQGCTRTDTINAYLLNPIKSDTIACDTFKANVTQGGVLQYNWFDGSHAPIRNFTQSGNYYVDINYVSGCAIRDSINVTIVPSPNINLGPVPSFCKGNFTLNATNPTSTYVWSTNETTSQITVKTPGTYWVKVTDANGCKDSDTLTVRPNFGMFDFAMPNIVTPNDDKINDVVDFGMYQFSSLQIQIYNRWGQKVFENNSPDGVWKPTVDDGTYFYTAQYKIDCGNDYQTKNIKGYIQVLR